MQCRRHEARGGSALPEIGAGKYFAKVPWADFRAGGTSVTETKSVLHRAAGVLLHPTSLPGGFGVGDLGPAAYAWVDTLAAARQSLWQILPLCPPGYGASPYQGLSAFAGNTYLISPEALAHDGLLQRDDLGGADFDPGRADFGRVMPFKDALFHRAWENFARGAAPQLRPELQSFQAAEATWLDDFALFMALKDAHERKAWNEWPRPLVMREPVALANARAELGDRFDFHRFTQFLFFRQWRALREYANRNKVQVVGDMPIFVSADSADVWAHPDLFMLDANRRPTHVAGVPPDFFAKTGQRWGNPLYNWPELQRTEFAWWLHRLQKTLEQVDFVRIDHFRGFAGYWEIPADLPTAEKGRWAKALGVEFFEVVQKRFGRIPLIAEDLGEITPDVESLRDDYGLPGMRILQFAFGGAVESRFLPHMYDRNSVVYTGTHDNDTTRGWFNTLKQGELSLLQRYVPQTNWGVVWDLLRAAWASVADFAVAPLQDVLDLGTEARMNFPGTAEGNWAWRFRPDQLAPEALGRLREITEVYGRAPK